MSKISNLLITLAFVSSTAFASSPDCSSIPLLKKEVRSRTQQAQLYEEFNDNIVDIANDARIVRNASAGIGIASGLVLTGGNVGFALASASTVEATALNLIPRIILGVNQLVRAVPAIIGGLAGGLITDGFGGVGIGAAIAGNFDVIYFVGNGIYQFKKDGKKYEIDTKKLKNVDDDIDQAINQLSEEIEDKIENAPAGFSNSLSFGGKNYRHFSELVSMTEARARLQYEMVNLSVTKLNVLQAICK